MKTELRECPFCGERTFVKFTPLEGCTDIGNITCVCGFVYTTISQGLDDWNVRPIEEGLRAEIEALQQELDELKELTRWHNGDFENPTKEGEYWVIVQNLEGEKVNSMDYWHGANWRYYGWRDDETGEPRSDVLAWSEIRPWKGE